MKGDGRPSTDQRDVSIHRYPQSCHTRWMRGKPNQYFDRNISSVNTATEAVALVRREEEEDGSEVASNVLDEGWKREEDEINEGQTRTEKRWRKISEREAY